MRHLLILYGAAQAAVAPYMLTVSTLGAPNTLPQRQSNVSYVVLPGQRTASALKAVRRLMCVVELLMVSVLSVEMICVHWSMLERRRRRCRGVRMGVGEACIQSASRFGRRSARQGVGPQLVRIVALRGHRIVSVEDLNRS
jgi:hypothetical protein